MKKKTTVVLYCICMIVALSLWRNYDDLFSRVVILISAASIFGAIGAVDLKNKTKIIIVSVSAVILLIYLIANGLRLTTAP